MASKPAGIPASRIRYIEDEAFVTVTEEEAARLARHFKQTYPYLYVRPLPPKVGGTYLHCQQPVDGEACGKRFKRMKSYRRHWRRKHGRLDN